ncbi:hypothetical protein DF268_35855 [Streptomyces sp. V2]|uniref:hypothetical protein n=1 Tax=Streptomyces sp. V2 TaxID=1424099 RepID=UPI000D670BCC|nr:hypothetical protein [Streptomyces sp. V2]PWG08750.1 hypothetical protein DF268_35855 [Streptomyces sp. V2]
MKAQDRSTSPGDEAAVPEHLTRDLDRDDLSRMVRDANAAGASFATMEKRARDAGYPLSRSQFNKFALNTVKSAPDEAEIMAIAAGIEKPQRLVTRAAARQYLNFESTELSGFSDEIRVIVAHLAGMQPEDQRRWRAMIEADERSRLEQQHQAEAE